MAKLLSCKELAWSLNRNVNYIYAMRAAGFVMPGDRATLQMAIEWLSENPDFRQYRVYPSRRPEQEQK
jgi:hypothetical protein